MAKAAGSKRPLIKAVKKPQPRGASPAALALSGGAALLAAALCLAAAAWASRHRWAPAAPPPPPVTLLYCDGGHYFKFFEPALRAAVAPRALQIVEEEAAASPHAVAYSVTGGAHRSYPAARRILFVGEPSFHPASAQAAHLTVHCARDLPGAAYVPFWATSFGERRRHAPADLLHDTAAVERALAGKTRFCAFLYSRPAQERDALFDLLSAYKPVAALGRSKSGDARAGADRAVYTPDLTYMDLAVQKYAPFKFVIAGENSRRPGYVTEKIVSAMLAHAVPIYVGAPDIAEHFDPGSFIDASAMTPEALLAEVRRLDADDDAYRAMLMRPWLPGNALPKWFDVEWQADMLRPGLEGLREGE